VTLPVTVDSFQLYFNIPDFNVNVNVLKILFTKLSYNDWKSCSKQCTAHGRRLCTTRRPASADRTARRKLQATGQPV